MSAPQALIEFFQQEAFEYLDRLDQLLTASENACPEANAFLTHARALRGSATMTRLEALPDLAATIERIAAGVRDNELRWDQRLHFAVHGALVELRDLVGLANAWTETEQRRSRTQSVALAAVAAGYRTVSPSSGPTAPVVPISRFFPDDGLPGILERNPSPPCTLPQRFRSDIAVAAAAIARETEASLAAADAGTGTGQPAPHDALRRALLNLGTVAESYGATSIAALAVTMARAPLEGAGERVAVQSFAQLLQDQVRSDQELAAHVKEATLAWPGRRTPPSASVSASASASASVATPSTGLPQSPRTGVLTPPRLIIRDVSASPRQSVKTVAVASELVPIEQLLYSGAGALRRAQEVRDELRVAWTAQGGTGFNPAATALLDELSDLLDLAVAI